MGQAARYPAHGLLFYCALDGASASRAIRCVWFRGVRISNLLAGGLNGLFNGCYFCDGRVVFGMSGTILETDIGGVDASHRKRASCTRSAQ